LAWDAARVTRRRHAPAGVTSSISFGSSPPSVRFTRRDTGHMRWASNQTPCRACCPLSLTRLARLADPSPAGRARLNALNDENGLEKPAN